jgi:hypothetical protein
MLGLHVAESCHSSSEPHRPGASACSKLALSGIMPAASHASGEGNCGDGMTCFHTSKNLTTWRGSFRKASCRSLGSALARLPWSGAGDAYRTTRPRGGVRGRPLSLPGAGVRRGRTRGDSCTTRGALDGLAVARVVGRAEGVGAPCPRLVPLPTCCLPTSRPRATDGFGAASTLAVGRSTRIWQDDECAAGERCAPEPEAADRPAAAFSPAVRARPGTSSPSETSSMTTRESTSRIPRPAPFPGFGEAGRASWILLARKLRAASLRARLAAAPSTSARYASRNAGAAPSTGFITT